MKIEYQELYKELLGPEDNEANLEKVTDRLVDLVILVSDAIAEQVNMYDDNEKIRWLLDQGFTVDKIKEFVGRTGS